MLTRKCDICGAEMRKTTPRYKVTFDGWLYTEEIDICIDCFKRIVDEIRPADTPQTETQTGTQNSNLTFEKDECAKEYEELGLKELKELIEADRKTEPTSSKMEQVEDETRLTAKCLNCANGGSYKCSKCDGEMYFKDEPQTCEDCKHNGEKHAYDYACDKCTDMDKFQHEDEPQTDCAWMKGE